MVNSNAKINKFQVVGTLLEKQVLRFDISMNDSPPMDIDQGLKKLTHNCLSNCLIGRSGYNSLEKLSSFTELKYEDVTIFIIVHFEQS